MNSSGISNRRDPHLYGPRMMDGTYPTPARLQEAIDDGQAGTKRMCGGFPDVVPHRPHHVTPAGQANRPYARPPTPPPPLPDPNEGKWFFWELFKAIVTGKSDWDHQFDGSRR